MPKWFAIALQKCRTLRFLVFGFHRLMLAPFRDALLKKSIALQERDCLNSSIQPCDFLVSPLALKVGILDFYICRILLRAFYRGVLSKGIRHSGIRLINNLKRMFTPRYIEHLWQWCLLLLAFMLRFLEFSPTGRVPSEDWSATYKGVRHKRKYDQEINIEAQYGNLLFRNQSKYNLLLAITLGLLPTYLTGFSQNYYYTCLACTRRRQFTIAITGPNLWKCLHDELTHYAQNDS